MSEVEKIESGNRLRLRHASITRQSMNEIVLVELKTVPVNRQMTRGNPTISSERERMSEETKDEMN
jgi:hypothetical protein